MHGVASLSRRHWHRQESLRLARGGRVAVRRHADAQGCVPPFRLRPGLVAEMLRFYDALRRNERSIDVFERLTLGALEPDVSIDRGAERLVRQTRFLVAAFRAFERASADSGAADEHRLVEELLGTSSSRPWRHVVVTVDSCGAEDRATRVP